MAVWQRGAYGSEEQMSDFTITHNVSLYKTGLRRTREEKLRRQLDRIIERALSGRRKERGWIISIANSPQWSIPINVNDEYAWLVELSISCNNAKRTVESLQQDFDIIIQFIGSAGAVNGWEITAIDGQAVNANKDERLPTPIGYTPVEIPVNWSENFEHIYARESQIEILISCLRAGIDSAFQNRFHCALIGDPACGKTETLKALKAVVGRDAVLEYDATATTQAGAIKDLDSRDELPRILIVEEIEKTDPDSLRWLLSVMDHRAEIRKITARQQILRETRMLTLATVNDYPLFLKLMYGALASRFTYHLHFPRPDQALLRRILEREVERSHGKKVWIKPTLEYAEENEIYDPRRIVAICLCGKDQLLGQKEYQKRLKECDPATFLKLIETRNKKGE